MPELRDGTRKKWQASLTHMDLHKTNTKWLVHSWNTFGARTNHGQLGHTRLTTAWTWGKSPPSPYSILCASPRGPHPNGLFVPRLPSGSFEIPTVGTLATLKAQNFLCKLSIVTRSEAKLYPWSRAFQWYVVHHLRARKSGRFLTFSG
jgi:hypothetical protein